MAVFTSHVLNDVTTTPQIMWAPCNNSLYIPLRKLGITVTEDFVAHVVHLFHAYIDEYMYN